MYAFQFMLILIISKYLRLIQGQRSPSENLKCHSKIKVRSCIWWFLTNIIPLNNTKKMFVRGDFEVRSEVPCWVQTKEMYVPFYMKISNVCWIFLRNRILILQQNISFETNRLSCTKSGIGVIQQTFLKLFANFYRILFDLLHDKILLTTIPTIKLYVESIHGNSWNCIFWNKMFETTFLWEFIREYNSACNLQNIPFKILTLKIKVKF